MPDLKREAHVTWVGGLKQGRGEISSPSGALKAVPYSVPSRFENSPGTNPEELIAAAHAACFSMMLAKVLGDRKVEPERIQTQATLSMGQIGGAWKITSIRLQTQVTAAGLDERGLQEAAAQAKDQCPVSLLLRPGLESITLEASLTPAGE